MFGEDPKREDLTILAPKQDDPTDQVQICALAYLLVDTHNIMIVQIFVFFPEDVKVGVKSIKTVCEQMKADNVKRAIMVVISNLTPFARQCLEEVRQVHYIETVGAKTMGSKNTRLQQYPVHTVSRDGAPCQHH